MTNKDNLKRMSNIPDTDWKAGWLAVHEGPTHFFHWNEYNRSILRSSMPLPLSKAVELVGRQVVADNGSAVWRSHQIFDLFQTALNKREWSNVIKMGGVLGHYIGDLAQPMHVTSDYNGQSINKPGIHSLFETKLVNFLDRNELFAQVKKRASEKLSALRSKNMSDTVQVSFEQGKRSLEQLPKLLNEYKRVEIREEILVPQLVDALAEGASTLALIWDQATLTESTQEFPSQKLIIHAPKWVSFKLTNAVSVIPFDACEPEHE